MSRRPDTGGSLLDWMWQGVIGLLALAFGVRLAASWLAGTPLLLILGALVSVLWFACRYRAGRRPWQGGPWP